MFTFVGGGAGAWRTRDGKTLVEGPPARCDISDGRGPIRKMPGEALERAHVYYLLGTDWELIRTYQGNEWSIDDDLGRSAYLVDGGSLREHVGVADTSDGETRFREHVELDGLSLLADGTVGDDVLAGARARSRSGRS